MVICGRMKEKRLAHYSVLVQCSRRSEKGIIISEIHAFCVCTFSSLTLLQFHFSRLFIFHGIGNQNILLCALVPSYRHGEI
jgi:hypothetical protein